MRSGHLAVVIIAAAFGLASAAKGAAPSRRCVSYGERTVLSGVLVRQTFPGAPNFESVRGGDEKETGWYLKLGRPVCVGAGAAGSPDVSEASVSRVQLVLDADQYRANRRLVGRSVRVSGHLFHGFTGHHHALLLLDQVSFER